MMDSETSHRGFSPGLIEFLQDLSQNNRRDWFKANESRYQEEVLEPAFSFIRAMRPRIHAISPHFVAEARKVRGSLMRVHRDVRFSKDKRPYKTNVGIRFPHESCGDISAPGFYVHLSPEEIFLGVGVWHPAQPSLVKIREKVDLDPKGWLKVRDNKRFRELFQLAGESLKTAPKGYPSDHPLIEDLRRKDFIAAQELSVQEALDPAFLEQTAEAFRASAPYIKFICDALGVAF